MFLSQALGGASGGYSTGRRELIEMQRQRARPYLFSNTLAPCIVGAAIEVFSMLSNGEIKVRGDKCHGEEKLFRDSDPMC